MNELLPGDLLWAEGGHASDVVLTALADGQTNIVPQAVLAHVERCATCTMHLGHAALLSLHAERELGLPRALATAKRPLPRLAIALGLVIALLGLVPSMLAGPLEAESLRAFFTHDVPLLLRGAGTVARRVFEPGAATGLALSYGTALLLVAMGFAVVRLLPKKEMSR